MATIEGIQISIPIGTRRASKVIESMEQVLSDRHHGLITRAMFLGRWKKLRVALRLTWDYEQLRASVMGRNDGRCEVCDDRPSVEMHHKARVAMHPRLALVPSNCVAVCKKCHKAQPGHK